MVVLEAHRRDLDCLLTAGRRRSLVSKQGVDFASNDYLALSGSPRLRQAAADAIGRQVEIGSGGSRLLRGNCDEHVRLEEEAARFFRSEAALFIGSGYGGNAVLFSTLPQRGDLVVYDELVHASAHEGMRLGRAEVSPFKHNDVDSAADVIFDWRRRGGSGTAWIAVESLYSMDGDLAPLVELASLARRADAMLLIDEAHATGVFGEDGRGLAANLDGHENVVVLRTCGKALGCEGALVLASATVCDFIVNRGRGFIFSTAPSPLIAAIVREGLACLRDEPERRERLQTLIGFTSRALKSLQLSVSNSQIQPVVIGDDHRTMAIAMAMQEAGFDVRGVRPPTVPPGTSRLRLSLTLNIDEADVVALLAALGPILEQRS